jgi:para-aminobenzoate synthetase component 1
MEQTKTLAFLSGHYAGWFEFSDLHSGYIYYLHQRFNIKKQEFEKIGIEELASKLKSIKVNQDQKTFLMCHFFYEWGFSFNHLSSLIAAETPLAIYCQYRKVEKKSFKIKTHFKLEPIKVPQFSEYQKTFRKIQNELHLGNCYQVNLTFPFVYHSKDQLTFEGVTSALSRWPKKTGAFAHATSIEGWRYFYVSNSPECLFKIDRQNSIHSFPIKGTIAMPEEKNFSSRWNRLIKSEKNRAELFMIIDLMRNDLAKIDGPKVQVLAKQKPLSVSGLLHTYAHLQTQLSDQNDLLQIIAALFPGGSITGAPKKSVMKIIYDLEKRNRGFYCGSTLLWHKSLKAASINIRSATVDQETSQLTYGAGGGITLLSDAHEEFHEMLAKVNSFLDLVNKPPVNC